MPFPVRPEWSTASVGSSHAPTDAVDHSAPSAIRPESTYISGKVVQTNGATSECLLHDFSKLTPTSTTVATRLKGRAFDIFQSLTGLVVSRKYLRVGEEKARGRQPARRAAAPQPPAAGVADQPVSQTAVCDRRARAPSDQRRRVSYPVSDSVSCIRPVQDMARRTSSTMSPRIGETGGGITPAGSVRQCQRSPARPHRRRQWFRLV